MRCAQRRSHIYQELMMFNVYSCNADQEIYLEFRPEDINIIAKARLARLQKRLARPDPVLQGGDLLLGIVTPFSGVPDNPTRGP